MFVRGGWQYHEYYFKIIFHSSTFFAHNVMNLMMPEDGLAVGARFTGLCSSPGRPDDRLQVKMLQSIMRLLLSPSPGRGSSS